MSMATTPEEFFIKDLMEQPPLSPPVFLDLPHKPNASNEDRHHVPNNDMTLPYISRMLMEDDDDELGDHPALLQVQQPFAEILSSPPLVGNNTNNSEGPNDFLHEGTYELLDQTEESNIINSRVNRAVMMTTNELEDRCANEMVDKMILHAYETCIGGMERVTIDVEKRNRKRKAAAAARGGVVDIRRVLTSCAQALAADDHATARELLKRIKQHASATGDTTQRLAHCFAKGLEARILGTGGRIWPLLVLEYPSGVELLKAYSLYSEACCFITVTFIFSAMIIMQAMAGKSRLHIVDYGTRFGFQWAGLLRLLASKEGDLPEVEITAIARPTPICYPGEQIEKVGSRLMQCAHELGLPSFKFHAVTKNWEDATCTMEDHLHRDADEVLVVIDLFSFSILMEESMFFDAPSPRDTVLCNIRKMRPDVFIQSVVNRSYGSSFLSRFREILFYCTAMFDMLDATLPRESESRLVFEKLVLGCYAFNGISCEGSDLVLRPEKYRQWQARNERAGLRQLPLKPSIVKVVKDEVMKHYHKDFLVCQDGQWLLQGWMGRVLTAHTTWVANGDASSG
ncbi:scarecrow-like protein 9 isoform X4 [Zea mays]|uniref:Uncharacterized protein n=1 Tax=Zea mays TaxID=4577 RepID=K7TYB9_MAIZE|nr:scarecrow-like protein 9 isoform X4 [Zea mays]XP_035823052.1 scarecrow-like protein 9 isoform X4 [Zea mays]AQK48406.1 hypothetical protein ZEAMMB73_Zm00001d048681 [Zea mays]